MGCRWLLQVDRAKTHRIPRPKQDPIGEGPNKNTYLRCFTVSVAGGFLGLEMCNPGTRCGVRVKLGKLQSDSMRGTTRYTCSSHANGWNGVGLHRPELLSNRRFVCIIRICRRAGEAWMRNRAVVSAVVQIVCSVGNCVLDCENDVQPLPRVARRSELDKGGVGWHNIAFAYCKCMLFERPRETS